jgi:hypothetical protein
MSDGTGALFESVAEETPWEWAKKRRRIFTSPLKDFLSGLFVGIAGGIYRYAAGDRNWKIAVVVSLLTLAFAVGLPLLETVVWRLRRNKILLEDAQDELRRARSAPRVAQAPTRPAPDRPVASLAFVCDQTGWARLRVTNNGTGATFSATVQTYGLTAGAVEGRLVPAKWEEVDTPTQRIARGDTRVLRLASVEARQVPTIRNWVIHRAGGADVRGTEDTEIVDVTLTAEPDLVEASRVRIYLRASGVSEMLPLGLDAARGESQRLVGMRRILWEAAEYVRAMPRGRGSAEDTVRAAWVTHNVVPVFLTRAFVVPPSADYMTYLNAEKEKRGDDFDFRDASADFLERLAGRIAEDNLDQGFLMPGTWIQFRNTDPPENWPADRR